MPRPKDILIDANERVSRSLSPFANEYELEHLGDKAISIIKAELRKAGLDSVDQVEEVFQSSLLSMLQLIEERGSVKELRPFFLTLIRNEARRHRVAAILKGEAILPQEPLADERRAVLQALPRLSERNRRILELTMVENLSDAEISARLKLSPAAVRAAK